MPRGMGRGRGAVEKPKDFGGVMKKLVKFCSRYIPVMIFALVLGAAGTVCQIIGPDKLKDMTNEITKGLPAMVHGKPVMNSIDMDAVSRIAWLLVALYVGYALLSYLQSWLMANVTQRTAQQLREAISQKIQSPAAEIFRQSQLRRRAEPHHQRRRRDRTDARPVGRLAHHIDHAVLRRAHHDVLQQRDHDAVRHRLRAARPDHHGP